MSYCNKMKIIDHKLNGIEQNVTTIEFIQSKSNATWVQQNVMTGCQLSNSIFLFFSTQFTQNKPLSLSSL